MKNTAPKKPIYKIPKCEKRSLGIACCRIQNGKPQILLICKKNTYSYNKFVHGKYSSKDRGALINLFSGMTIDEKIDIMSLNFAQVWYRSWINHIPKNSIYYTSKSKYENTFATDNGLLLRKLLEKSKTAKKVWEIPKGKKKNKNESDIQCAVREFHEETGIHVKNYKIYPAKRTYSYIDEGQKYVNTYYIAFTRMQSEPTINFSNKTQLEEVCDIRYCTMEDIRILDSTGRLENFVRPIFKYIKKHSK